MFGYLCNLGTHTGDASNMSRDRSRENGRADGDRGEADIACARRAAANAGIPMAEHDGHIYYLDRWNEEHRFDPLHFSEHAQMLYERSGFSLRHGLRGEKVFAPDGSTSPWMSGRPPAWRRAVVELAARCAPAQQPGV
jgi:hypothetical protein